MKKAPLLSSLLLGGLALTLAATPALAQTETAPPPNNNPPASVVLTTPSGGGAGIGIGAVATLGGLAGGQVVYDLAMFHIEGILGYQHISRANMMPSSSNFGFGVGGWYHLFRGVNSDFSLGGLAGIIYGSTGPTSATGFTLEPGAQARVFLTPNFALEGRVGFAITFGDNNADTTITIGGQTTANGPANLGTNAGFGFTYFIR
jgi:hypothetical protein